MSVRREGEDIWRINWEAITITFVMNGDLLMANKQYHRLLLRSAEGIYKSFNIENIIRLLLDVKLKRLQN